GVTPQAQRRYEKGERTPDGEYLSAFAELGADVHYILTGKRQASPSNLDPSIVDVLAARGVTIVEDKLFGSRVVGFSSTGMAWLLNYIEFHQYFSPALSWGLLSGLASF
ncbi:helix-turn-helix domain-containing protein, partial [Aromatoleum toluclasticum]|uniref:helix-turn-helix domain-containing protein n=1 Tax=Aromatoleum toluclasticum TaxID=92003 RepID=UPI001D1867C9